MKLKHTPRHPQKPATSKRFRARLFAMQGVYQWLMTGYDYAAIEPWLREEPGFNKSDIAWFSRLLEGSLDHRVELEDSVENCLDRPLQEVSPIERAILLVAAYELKHCLEVPFQVVINEAIELAKRFGGTDGHKYINGVLNRLSGQLRELETTRLSS